jgi:hypothetical protein
MVGKLLPYKKLFLYHPAAEKQRQNLALEKNLQKDEKFLAFQILFRIGCNLRSRKVVERII